MAITLHLPILIINFKNYERCYGQKAVELAKTIQKVAEETGASLAIAPNNIDLYRVAHQVRIPVFAQHLTPITFGSHTGHVLPEAVKEAGAVGTLLNHAEKTRDLQTVGRAVARCREVGLLSLVCADTAHSAAKIAGLRPDLIAIEPPELIGKTSVTSANPKILTDTLEQIGEKGEGARSIPVLCGAGVKTGEDVTTAIRLGMKGILLASGVVLAENPKAVLLEMARALR